MDTLRGTFDAGDPADRSWDATEEENAEPANRRDLPPGVPRRPESDRAVLRDIAERLGVLA